MTKTELQERLDRLRASVEADVRATVKSEVENTVRLYKLIALAFAAGFALFLTIGLVTRGLLFESIIKSIYTPEQIHNDLKPQLSSHVWNTVSMGTAADYERFISRNEFYEALRTYHTELVKTFLLPTRERAVRAFEILKVGKTPLDVTVLMVGKEYDGKPTERCHNEFSDKEVQAILVIPKSAEPAEYAWFDCAFGWPKLILALKVGTQEITDLRLVGLRRNGGTERLQVLVSREAAKRLQLPGWDTYKSHAFGRVRVANVE